MALFDFLKSKQYKQEIIQLQTLNVELNAEIEELLTPELRDLKVVKDTLKELNNEVDSTTQQITTLNNQITALTLEIKDKKRNIIELDDAILLQEFGLYEPKYEFMSSETYKVQLNSIRTSQKEMIKNKTAVTGNTAWTVDNSKAKGKKMVTDMQKLLMRAFNSECDEVISKVKYNNIESAQKRITASHTAISKLGTIMSIEISWAYFELKMAELKLSLEYQIKKQEEKEEQKEIKQQMREEAKLQKEIEEEKKKIAKEQNHYENALKQINDRLINADENEKDKLLEKQQELENELVHIGKSLEDIDYRQANARAGYVYVISNIGAFGENVYKIGMTRRLEPTDRVDELGDASVPFNFDIHAMIFSDNAPKLENSLHKAFENKKLNFVNTRREFFNVTLEEIKNVVTANYDKTVEFTELAVAEQYRTSLKMREELQAI